MKQFRENWSKFFEGSSAADIYIYIMPQGSTMHSNTAWARTTRLVQSRYAAVVEEWSPRLVVRKDALKTYMHTYVSLLGRISLRVHTYIHIYIHIIIIISHCSRCISCFKMDVIIKVNLRKKKKQSSRIVGSSLPAAVVNLKQAANKVYNMYYNSVLLCSYCTRAWLVAV